MALWHTRMSIGLLALAACASIDVALASGPAPSAQTSQYETDFMRTMTDHHSMAIRMADICSKQATHAELLQMCRGIRTTQSAEVQQMQSWLQAWYGTSYRPQMTREDKQQLQARSQLSDAEFEIAFMRAMIEHHQGAIMEAGDCLGAAYHKELIQLCGSIVEAQAAEIVTMRGWLCDWYQICDPRTAAVARSDGLRPYA